MARRALVAASLAVCALSCAELPELSLGQCGNGVLEDGEDCDLHPDEALGPGTACGLGASGCLYVCTPDGVPSCPVSWACGSDGICRHGTGTFVEAPGSPWPIEGPSLATGDFDGNGDLDVLAASDGGIAVRFGAAPGEFGRVTTLGLVPNGAPTAADLDADGNADVVMAVTGGLLVLRGNDDQTLSPVAYSPYDFSGLSENLVLGTLSIYPALHQSILIYLMEIDGSGYLFFNAGDLPMRLPANHGVAELAGSIATGELDPPASLFDQEEFVLAFRGDDQLYLFEARSTALGGVRPILRDTLQLPGPVLQGVLLADLDLDGSNDLLVSIDDGTVAGRAAVALADGAGGFGPFAFDWRFDTLTAGACDAPSWSGEHRWPLAVAQLGAGPGADLITAEGVVYDIPPGLCPFDARGDDPWRDAAVADFDADGFLDLAVAGQDDSVEFLFGEGVLLFTHRRVPLRGKADKLRAGDFDGDGVADLALVTRGGEAGDTVEVLYGQARGVPTAPVTMGSFPSIHELLRLGVNTDRADDLLLISSSEPFDAGVRSAGLLFGTTDRYLVSPFSLRNPVTNEDDVPLVVLAGRFDPAHDQILDLLALAPPDLWLLPGAGGARFQASTAARFPLPAELSDFDPRHALFAVADLDGDGVDEVIGVDGAGRVDEARPSVLLVVRAGTEEAPMPTFSRTPLPTNLVGPHRLLVRDVDGDGAPDLLLAFHGSAEAVEGSVRTGALVLFGGGPAPGDRGTLELVAPQEVGRVWSIDAVGADGDPDLELVVLTELGVHLLELDGKGELQLPATPALELSLPGGQVRTVDLDHDGLDDLLLDDGQVLRSFLAAPHVSR